MRNNKILHINEGEFYLFFNFYKGREEITLGFPFKGSDRNDVYLAINQLYHGRISFKNANKYLSQSLIKMLPLHRIKGILTPNKSLTSTCTCAVCEKKLRGDLTKIVCTECYTKSGRPDIDDLKALKSLNKTTLETYRLLINGYSINEMASYRSVKKSTIFNHLQSISEIIDLNNFDAIKPSDDLIKKIRRSIFLLDEPPYLKDIFDSLNGAVEYEDIRHAMLFIEK